MLFVYYLFLIATLVMLAAFAGSSLLSQPRKAYVAELLVPPLILLVVLLKLGFVLTVILTIVLVVFGKGLLTRYKDSGVTRVTVFYSLGLCLLDAIVPLSVHFAFRARPEIERFALLITAFLLLLAPIFVLAIWAPDLGKKA
jgi:hypothetical protein